MVNKQGDIIYDSRSLYYFVTNRETGSMIAKFKTVEQCLEEIKLMNEPKRWKVSCDWVIVKG
jgi:hypothetical protein